MLRLPHDRCLSPAVLPALLTVLLVVCTAILATPARAAGPVEVTAAASPAVVDYPGSAEVSGVVTGGSEPLAGAALSLFERPAGSADWASAGSTMTGADGAFSFPVSPTFSTDYRVVHDVDGQPVAEAAASVQVRPRLRTSFPAGLWLGGSVVLRGRVEPKHPGGTVAIDRRVAGAWQPLLTVTLNAQSRFALPWRPSEFGYYRLRVRMDPDTAHAAAVSTSERIIVNRPNAHRVPLRYARYIVIVRHEYRLYYYEHGALVRAFDVALGRPGYRTPLGYYRVYGKRKPAGGALGACAMFYRRKGGIAIHGTNQPGLIRSPAPRAYSHGCARMLNRQVLWLYDRVPVGTRVHNLR
jgi:lipoprotein-anchoring transpeptidase ErfK/SrfK